MYYPGYPPPPGGMPRMPPPPGPLLPPPPHILIGRPPPTLGPPGAGPPVSLNPVGPVATAPPRGTLVPTSVNPSYNLNSLLANNIATSKYYKQLQTEYPTFEDLVQVLVEEATHVEPYMPGKGQRPSEAFSVLYRFFEMKLDERQMETLFHHKVPLIRCMPLLYLRCVGDSSIIMDWITPYLNDPTEITPTPDGRKTTIGDWVNALFQDIQYGGTVLRRIPIPLARQIERKTMELQILKERSERSRHKFKPGLKCKAMWSDGGEYDAVVDEVLENGHFLVTYLEYKQQEEVTLADLILLPEDDTPASNSSSTTGSGSSSAAVEGEKDWEEAEGERERSVSKSRSSVSKSRRSRSKSPSRKGGESSRRRRRSRSKSRDKGEKGEREKRSRSREKRDKDKDKGDRGRRSKDRERDRERDRGRRSKDRDRERERDRRGEKVKEKGKEKGEKEGRRSRERERAGSRRDRDRDREKREKRPSKSREMAPVPTGESGRPLTVEEEIQLRLQQKRKQARSSAVASDGNYSRVVVGYKRMLGETAESVSKPRFESRT
eukprot:gb/GEZN01003485.1/.p1 GENE.gb/GEZN01003485.1/~~gb/GEZN01003485.1/.p1  ORF type:complete len:549 (-),score=64.76 gb/GEZN01003485.1/:283-1929(-)